MSTHLYDVNVTLASLANVPPRGFTPARRNGRAAGEEESDFVIPTEFWHLATRRGFDDGMPDHMSRKGLSPLVNSTALYYNKRTFRPLRTGSLLLHGVVAGSFGLVSDPRRMPWGVFEHRATGRRLVVGAVHLAPKGSRKGPAAVEASRRAHERAFSRLDAFVERFDYPVLLGGDWNRQLWEVDLELGTGSYGEGIDGAALADGVHAEFGRAMVSRYKLPASDHPGVRISVPVLAREAR